jgi:hypothetical protein
VPLAKGATCMEYFYELLGLESRIPGGPGAFAHFYAVGCYHMQHPSIMLPHVLHGLRKSVADAVAGRASIKELRERARSGSEGPTRVVRRPGDNSPPIDPWWPTEWPMTVLDVCRLEADQSLYVARTKEWAESILRTLADAESAEKKK